MKTLINRSFKKKRTIRRILLGSILVFIASYIGWVMLWSQQGAGLKIGKIGYHTCIHCGMILSDKRHIVSILIKDEFNNDETLYFDDIGCFISHAKKEKLKNINGVVYDFDSLVPISIQASFFENGKYQTPMASGWIARKYENNKAKRIKEILR